jgi:antitoxin PrlF
MAFSTISSKGQVTVPVEVRTRLGLKTGDRVEFVLEDDRTVLLPAQKEANPFTQFVGILPPLPNNQSSLEFWREMRGHDPNEEDLS